MKFTINYTIDGQVVVIAENEVEAEEKFRNLPYEKLIDGLFLEEPRIDSIE